MKVNSYLAETMNKYESYDVEMEEIHHIHKLDKPSGTAITLANQILEKLDRKTNWSISEKEKILYLLKTNEKEKFQERTSSNTHQKLMILKSSIKLTTVKVLHLVRL